MILIILAIITMQLSRLLLQPPRQLRTCGAVDPMISVAIIIIIIIVIIIIITAIGITSAITTTTARAKTTKEENGCF
jgi:hypothetical protein